MSKLPPDLEALISSVRPTPSLLKALDTLRQENLVFPASAKSAPVPGGSGALLAGNPLTLSGDAWESAAQYFIDQKNGNADAWKDVAEFLEDQELDALGLRRIPSRSSSEAAPVGNHGDNNLPSSLKVVA